MCHSIAAGVEMLDASVEEHIIFQGCVNDRAFFKQRRQLNSRQIVKKG